MLPDPYDALAAAENTLRLIIRQQLVHDEWRSEINVADLEAKRLDEQRKRDGAKLEGDLLAYASFWDLSKIIRKYWNPHFQGVFKDKKRTDAWLEILDDRQRTLMMIDTLGKVRNTIGHSRELLPFERYLVAGVSGQLRNLITEFRTAETPVNAHYPLIESVTDSFGNIGSASTLLQPVVARVEVGDELIFSCRGSDGRGRQLEWFTDRQTTFSYKKDPGAGGSAAQFGVPTWDILNGQLGEDVTLRYTTTEQDVGETMSLDVYMRSFTGRFRRHRPMLPHMAVEYDDVRRFKYAVTPPVDEA